MPSADSEPTPLGAPTIPDVGLWSDSDPPTAQVTTPIAFSGLVATPTDRAMPTIGHIGRYALKYQLGEGGLGTVFAAHDPLLSRLIAVKTLNVKVADEERESFNALFLNEARAAGGLSHPHIVTVFDAGISDERAERKRCSGSLAIARAAMAASAFGTEGSTLFASGGS